MKTTNTIQQVREEHQGVSSSADRTAVIVCTPYGARKSRLGVQFWTKDMIASGSAMNADRSVSTYIGAL